MSNLRRSIEQGDADFARGLRSLQERNSMMPPPHFDAEYLERRMREHREWQERHARELEEGIVSEVYVAIVRAQGAQEEEFDFDA